MKLELDVRQFQKALREYQSATGKDGMDVLNRAGRNVAYRASQFTPMANRARIRSGLFSDPHLRYALTSISLRKGGKKILKSPEFQKAVASFVNRRLSSSRYLRAAWAKAIQKMGGTFRGAKFKGAGGYAKPATIHKLLAELVAQVSQPDEKHAASAEKKMIPALQEALDFVAKDMIAHAQGLMAKTARVHSAK